LKNHLQQVLAFKKICKHFSFLYEILLISLKMYFFNFFSFFEPINLFNSNSFLTTLIISLVFNWIPCRSFYLQFKFFSPLFNFSFMVMFFITPIKMRFLQWGSATCWLTKFCITLHFNFFVSDSVYNIPGHPIVFLLYFASRLNYLKVLISSQGFNLMQKSHNRW
jgi:hypothetical protein